MRSKKEIEGRLHRIRMELRTSEARLENTLTADTHPRYVEYCLWLQDRLEREYALLAWVLE